MLTFFRRGRDKNDKNKKKPSSSLLFADKNKSDPFFAVKEKEKYKGTDCCDPCEPCDSDNSCPTFSCSIECCW